MLRLVLNSLITGTLGACGVLMQSLTQQSDISHAAMMIAGLTFLVMALNDIKSYLSPSPRAAQGPPPPQV